MRRSSACVLVHLFLTACSNGIIQISEDTYMHSQWAGLTYSGSSIKGDLIIEANEFCSAKGQKMQLLNSTHVDLTRNQYPSAEIQFKCIRAHPNQLLASNALPKFVKVRSGEDMTQYIDPATIVREGQMAKMWVLADYKAGKTLPAGDVVWSVKGQHEFNCATGQTRLLSFYAFSDHMASGEELYSEAVPRSAWEPIIPGSAGQAIGKIACEEVASQPTYSAPKQPGSEMRGKEGTP